MSVTKSGIGYNRIAKPYKQPGKGNLHQIIKGAGIGNAASTQIGVVTSRGIKAHHNSK